MELAAVLAVLAVVLGLPTAAGARPAARSAAVEPVSRVAPGRAGDALVARPRAQAPGHDGVAPRTAHAGRGDRGRSSAPVPAALRGTVAAGAWPARPWSPGSEPAPPRPAVHAASARGPPAVV